MSRKEDNILLKLLFFRRTGVDIEEITQGKGEGRGDEGGGVQERSCRTQPLAAALAIRADEEKNKLRMLLLKFERRGQSAGEQGRQSRRRRLPNSALQPPPHAFDSQNR